MYNIIYNKHYRYDQNYSEFDVYVQEVAKKKQLEENRMHLEGCLIFSETEGDKERYQEELTACVEVLNKVTVHPLANGTGPVTGSLGEVWGVMALYLKLTIVDL